MNLPAEHRGPAPGPAAVAPSAAPESIGAILERFVAGFNDNDLDAVMAFFAEDAVYAPGDGKEHRGKAAIRAAFRPQFEGAYGEMTFVVSDRLVDEAGRKAAIRWVCHHDLSRGQGGSALTRWVFRALYGGALRLARHGRVPLRRARPDRGQVHVCALPPAADTARSAARRPATRAEVTGNDRRPGDTAGCAHRARLGGASDHAVWLFAQAFYRHRQRRWRRLVARGFEHGA